MLASIIYNYGKIFGGFKSTLKLGAYDFLLLLPAIHHSPFPLEHAWL
jgi:hypothetical protein